MSSLFLRLWRKNLTKTYSGAILSNRKGVNTLTLGERIKKVRKDLDLTQQKFAAEIGTTANVLTNYETGRRNPSAAALNNICKTFGISEEWLRTGEGEPTIPTPETTLEKLISEYHLGDLEKQIILEFIGLDEKDRKGVIEYVQRLAQNKVLQAAQGASKAMTLEQEADEFAAMAREQFISEKKQASQALSAKESDVG